MIIKRLVMTDISQKFWETFILEFMWPKNKNRINERNSWLVARVMTCIICLQSVSEFWLVLRIISFHVNLRLFLLPCYLFFHVLTVWDESPGDQGHRIDKNESSISGVLSWKGFIQGNRLASVQDSWLSRGDVAYKWCILTCQSGSGVCAPEKWKVIKAQRQFCISDHFLQWKQRLFASGLYWTRGSPDYFIKGESFSFKGSGCNSTIALKGFLLSKYL